MNQRSAHRSLFDAAVSGTEPFELHQLDAVALLRSRHPESIDLIITDPAYESLEKHRAHGTTTRLSHSKASSNEWFQTFPNERFEELFVEAYRTLRCNAHLYVYCDQETMFVTKPIAEKVGFKFWKFLVWDKKQIGMGYHYRCRHEVILFLEKGKRRLNDLGVPDVIEAPRVGRRRQCVCSETAEAQWQASVERVAQESSTPRGTYKCHAEGSPTESSGSDITDPFPRGCRSTTRTKTSRTTPSTTSNSSTRLHTSASTQGASYAMASGGSHAPYVPSSSPSTGSTGTSTGTVDGQPSDDAEAATSALWSSGSEGGDWRACPRCGLDRGSWPTEKPVSVSEVLVRQSSEPGDLVVDPFMGSASVGVAALQQGRRFLGGDVSPDAMALASARLHAVTGVQS